MQQMSHALDTIPEGDLIWSVALLVILRLRVHLDAQVDVGICIAAIGAVGLPHQRHQS